MGLRISKITIMFVISLLQCCACEAYVISNSVVVQPFNCCLINNIFCFTFTFQGALYPNFTIALIFIVVGLAQNLLVVPSLFSMNPGYLIIWPPKEGWLAGLPLHFRMGGDSVM